MAAPIIQADYDALEELAGRFDDQAALSEQLILAIRQNSDALVGGGWQGRGIDAFDSEMTNEVFPALVRLSEALTRSGTTTRTIIAILRTAEEEAAALLQMEGGGGGPGGGGPGGGGPGGGPGGGGPGGGGPGGGGGGGSFGGGDGGITDIPTLGKGLSALYDLLEPHIGSLREVPGPVGALIGTIFDAWGNPDGDWIQSVTSSAIENFGLYAIGLGFPPAAVAQAISDVTQLANDISRAVDNELIDIIAANPQIAEGLQNISDDFHNNVDRLDLSNITGPLADAIYNVQIAPIVDSGRDLWNDPSLSNLQDLGINLAGLPYGIPIGAIRNPQHALDALGDLGDAGLGLVDFGIGAVNLQTLGPTRLLGFGTAASVHVVDALPLPGGVQDAFEDGAGFVVDALDSIPSIPGVSALGGLL